MFAKFLWKTTWNLSFQSISSNYCFQLTDGKYHCFVVWTNPTFMANKYKDKTEYFIPLQIRQTRSCLANRLSLSFSPVWLSTHTMFCNEELHYIVNRPSVAQGISIKGNWVINYQLNWCSSSNPANAPKPNALHNNTFINCSILPYIPKRLLNLLCKFHFVRDLLGTAWADELRNISIS